jgi:hypothetical protein
LAGSLTLPVPETLQATYAVAFTSPPPYDPRELARERVSRLISEPLRELVLRMLDSALLTLDLRPADRFPPLPAGLLAAFGAAHRELAAIAAATHLLAVRAAYRPGWPPAHEWAGRAVAGAAGALGADRPVPVIDVFTPQVLDAERIESSLPGPDGTIRLTDWILLPHTAGPGGFWFTTKGMARFGLPELQTEDVPAHLVEPWGQVLNGLASRLLGLWLEELRTAGRPARVRLPEIVSVGLQDVAAAQGTGVAEHGAGREVSLRLRMDIEEQGGRLLTVLPLENGPSGLASLCATLFGTSSSA